MKYILLCLLVGTLSRIASAQQTALPGQPDADRHAEIVALRQELKTIAARLDALEAAEKSEVAATPAEAAPTASVTPPVAAAAAPPPVDQTISAEDRTTLQFFRGTTLNFNFDGYYEYNFNQPIGRVNLLRAYDVSSNSFSINQADVIVEHLPTTEERYGGRIDLQYGQATETLQGSSVNELRPQVWRNLFQAYGSYLAPIGSSGLRVDFGKWASALGVEGNYTKDQINYSRSYLFNFLPFYHTGFRAGYDITPKVNVAYWLVNGAQQTEAFSGFKSEAFIVTLKPAKSIAWNVNYFFGQEQRDVVANLATTPNGPTQPGLPITNITPAPNGREHIFDTYATWTVTPKLTVVGEADYVINRVLEQSAPVHVSAGAVYLRYALPKNSAVAARAEYLSDRGGLFSGQTQALKETTFTYDHTFAPGFLTRLEYRRDFTNVPFFLTEEPGLLSHQQNTATLGLVYWWGMKQGAW